MSDPEPSSADETRESRFTIHDYFSPRGQPKRLRRLPRLIRLALQVVWRAARRELIISAALQLVTAAAIAVQLLVVRRLLSTLLQSEGTPSFGDVLPEIVAMAAVGAVIAFASIGIEMQQRLLGYRVALHTSDQVIDTATSVDLITYETPSFHDRLQRAQMSAGSRPIQLANGLLGIVGALLSIAGIGFALLIVQPLFFALVTVAFVPAWLATRRAGRLAYRFSYEQTERERRRNYLFYVLTRRDEAKEVRAFGLSGFLRGRHRELYLAYIDELRDVLRRRLRIALAGQAATALLVGASIGVLVWLVTDGRMSLSAAGSAAGAMILLSGQLRVLAGNTASLYEGSLFLEDYASFVDAAPRIAASRPTEPAPQTLAVMAAHNVSFTYPSRTAPSLVDASLELRTGEVVALVGENGSGKTTFAKLMAGLYQPQSGSITWDGVDIAAFDPASVRSRVAVIFQDFVRYQLSAYDNIALGDNDRYDESAEVARAAHAAGVGDAIEQLEAGYETLLGPEFYGGSDLSGGQWQRIGLARAFFRDAPIVILDEPTASLDARAEESLYAHMRDLYRDRGVLLISHRFGSVRTADRIYVLRNGHVVEQGSHAELMALDGYYAELFRLQARWYVD